jgi:predicted ABC-type ATPase
VEAVILVGIQASGKSTFFQRRFFDTHVRINLDMLKTRGREDVLLRACVAARQPFVVDNTNATAEHRARYLSLARAAGFRVTGYYFRTETRAAIARNRARAAAGGRNVPIPGLLGTYKRLEEPSFEEGFDALFAVTIDAAGEFVVEPFVPVPPPAAAGGG